ncbi:MAG TPA: class I SAM-dependent methyltransferase [Atribacteraceae bacterium]|nr:class I SAM-dependent methyltransferase [Atribacteraceae bacterium]
MDSHDIKTYRLYDELAWLFPILTPPEEYAEEAECWKTVLRKNLGPGRHRILELGIGGGHNLSHLTGEFEATAVDLSPLMLEQCRKLNPDVTLHLGDMRNVRLGKIFSAVLIHDAINYLLNEKDLFLTFETTAAHLLPGGLLIVGPDHFRETFQDRRSEYATHTRDGLELTYFEHTFDPDPAGTSLETIMVYMLREGEKLDLQLDRHVTGIFSKATWDRLYREAGFSYTECEFHLPSLDQPYILLVGVRQ